MNNTQTIKFALTSAAKLLNNEEATQEAQHLLQHVLNVNRAWLISHADDALEASGPGHPLSNSLNEFDSPCIHAAFEALLQRRLNGEPIAYILGEREFYGLTLKVTPDTLIPRPDTETLVEAALEKIAPDLPLSICDLGTGSGAIALAIAKNRPHAQVTAVDFSTGALNVAINNAHYLNIQNIQFTQSDWFSALAGQTFDVIVSNPPYIEAEDTHLKQGDLRFEPITALASGADGLNDIRTIINHASQHLNAQGWLMLEHGYNQAQQVSALLTDAEFTEVTTLQDLGGNNRVTLAQKR